jgi:hypothetical protein
MGLFTIHVACLLIIEQGAVHLQSPFITLLRICIESLQSEGRTVKRHFPGVAVIFQNDLVRSRVHDEIFHQEFPGGREIVDLPVSPGREPCVVYSMQKGTPQR